MRPIALVASPLRFGRTLTARRRAGVGRRLVLALSLGAARGAHAQAVTVRGLAWDSVRARPLAGAFVALGTDGRSASADERGRFRFDSVAPGAYVVSVQHATLDSIGLPGIATRVTVTDGRDELRVATPSFATLWGRVCDARTPPSDSGLVFGAVADARTSRPVANASVEATWDEYRVGTRRENKAKKLDVSQHRRRAVVRSDAQGRFAFCGIPDGLALTVQARADSGASGAIALIASDLRVRRLDLSLAPQMDSASVARGVIVGVVSAAEGVPLPDVRVVLDGQPEQRTDARGRVVLRDVPVGTRQVEVFSLGRSPVATTVNVPANDTVTFTAQLKKVATLDVVRVTASRRMRPILIAMEERRRQGFGYIKDSTAFQSVHTLGAAFMQFPSTRAERNGAFANDYVITFPSMTFGRCTANVYIDGVRADQDQLKSFQPDEFAVVEVYPHAISVPIEFSPPMTGCGSIVVWTKRGFH